jgi:ribosome-binding factor A
MSHRIERINNLIRQEVSALLQREVKDPRLGDFIAVTEVATSPDLKYAKIFVSRISNEEDRKETLKAFEAASGFLRKELMKSLRLRRIPELVFFWDDSIERGDRLLRLIDQVNAESGTDAKNG